jgi:hypothetical protein
MRFNNKRSTAILQAMLFLGLSDERRRQFDVCLFIGGSDDHTTRMNVATASEPISSAILKWQLAFHCRSYSPFELS